MKYSIKYKLKKFYLILLIYLFYCIPFSKAEVYKEIIISGNKRLNSETVLMFSGLKTGIDLSSDDLNLSIKKLYMTDYFMDVEINILNDILEIKVNENPIIQSILINGIKNKSTLNDVKEITKKTERYPFLKNNILEQKNLLLNLVRAKGFYFAKIETKIVDNKNNTIDIVYDFILGDKQ